ncbi:MAG TPA: GNAT family N-acetyltransferase [Candidatus Nanopelagicales bacterium]|nr:GNAT family N-acetyltransferase [Candidatus Nanopelagicales bacterium]
MIERATTEEQVREAAPLFDDAVRDDAVRRFLDDPQHHLLLARDGGRVVGFVSGVETTHPDKGTEMFLYELAVDPAAQRRGHGRALVEALADLARERGCYGMFVLTDDDNDAAKATYTAAGGEPPTSHVMIAWSF